MAKAANKKVQDYRLLPIQESGKKLVLLKTCQLGYTFILRIITGKAGFKNYEEEWWHFDYGNQRWSLYTNKPAIYGGVFKMPNG
jgi:hypothetical protein